VSLLSRTCFPISCCSVPIAVVICSMACSMLCTFWAGAMLRLKMAGAGVPIACSGCGCMRPDGARASTDSHLGVTVRLSTVELGSGLLKVFFTSAYLEGCKTLCHSAQPYSEFPFVVEPRHPIIYDASHGSQDIPSLYCTKDKGAGGGYCQLT
jgi:hypothetical protein